MAHREKHVQLGINVTPEIRATMQELSAKTRIPQSVLFREALEDLFAKYAEMLHEPKGPKAKK
jgi:predicted transcriptional regulator